MAVPNRNKSIASNDPRPTTNLFVLLTCRKPIDPSSNNMRCDRMKDENNPTQEDKN